MLPRHQPDRIRIAFDDHGSVANAGLILPATLALRLGLPQLVDRRAPVAITRCWPLPPEPATCCWPGCARAAPTPPAAPPTSCVRR